MRVDKIERQDNYELKKYAKLISRHNVIKLCPMSLMECHVYSESISIRSPSSGTGNVIKSRLMSRFQKKNSPSHHKRSLVRAKRSSSHGSTATDYTSRNYTDERHVQSQTRSAP